MTAGKFGSSVEGSCHPQSRGQADLRVPFFFSRVSRHAARWTMHRGRQ
jgi:hypothetical protein